MASYRDLASLANPGVQRLQNLVVPRISLTCLVEAGVGIFSTISLWASENYLWPPSKTSQVHYLLFADLGLLCRSPVSKAFKGVQ